MYFHWKLKFWADLIEEHIKWTNCVFLHIGNSSVIACSPHFVWYTCVKVLTSYYIWLSKKVIESDRVCSGLNRFGPHRLMCLNMLDPGSGTIRKYGLVGIGVALLEKVFHVVGGLGNLLLTDWKTAVFCLPPEQDVQFSAPLAPCLPECCHDSRHDDNGLNLWTCEPAPIKCCPL